MKLNELSKTIYEGNKLRGFWEHREAIPLTMKESGLFSDEEIKSVQDASKGQMLALIHSEISETLEANRGRTNTLNREAFERAISEGVDFKIAFEMYIKNSEPDELVDTIIRCFDYAGGFNIDIDWHIEQKLKYNSMRAFKHNKNY